jgi:hypothetical protein
MTAKQIDLAQEMGDKRAAGAFPLVEDYEARLTPARQRFDQHPAAAALFRERLAPDTLEAFLIYFSALGVGMTEPVEGWIRQAGRRCGEAGLPKLAKALEAHARQEADHHLLMQADANRLVARWNAERVMWSSASARLGGLLGVGGQVTSNSSACGTGTEAIAKGCWMIRGILFGS